MSLDVSSADSSATANGDGLRIVFAGTPAFSAQHLQALLDDGRHTVVAAYSQPDRPSGRGKKLQPTAVKKVAEAHNIPVLQPLSLKGDEAQATLAEFAADVMVVVAYGLLLPPSILQTPRLGCINVHGSILPRWRGAAPIQRAIAAGDQETGITIMQMDEGLDTGDMLLLRTCPINSDTTSASLYDSLAELGCDGLLEALDGLAKGTLPGQAQNDALATYAAKITKQEADIDWSQSAVDLDYLIRGFNPAPVAYTTVDGQRLRIWRAQVVAQSSDAAPGTVIKLNKDELWVVCGEGVLSLLELQLPGKRAMAWQDLANGCPAWLCDGVVLGVSN